MRSNALTRFRVLWKRSVFERRSRIPRADRILLSGFDRYTQPLIRYEIDDRVRAASGECECGRPFGIIEMVEGRVEDVLLFSRRDGATEPFQAHPDLFHEPLENLPVLGVAGNP